MTGKLYIDGLNAYVNFGIFITEGGYDGLVSFPPLKNVDSNDWPEEDGIEPDLSSQALDTCEFSITFAAHGDIRSGNFLELLSDKAYHVFDFREIGRTYKLRLTSMPNLDPYIRLEFFTLQFANDFPFPDEYVYAAPQSGYRISGYEFDGIDLSQYGIAILKGSLAEVQKTPAVKKNLLQNFNNKHGAIYDNERVTFQSKEVKLNGLMRANSLDEFWRNYNALLFDFVRPNEHSLYVDSTGYEYPCYYKSSRTNTFSPIGKVWFQFDLVLVFTSFRIDGEEYLLASEDDYFIVTEEDGELFIDMKYGN